MKYLDFYNKLDTMEKQDYIENYLLYSTSLVIAEVKPAVTIAIKKTSTRLYNTWNDFGKAFVDNIGLKFVELRENNDCIIVMIYNEKLLYKEISKNSHTNFLAKLGYPSLVNVTDYVNVLKSRYEKYHCPHELGLFLGIPFEDVKDFMECTTKKCLLCGYWKVFNNEEKAKITFERFDTIKEYTMKNILKGNSSYDLALSIKSFYKYKFIS